MLQLNLDGKMEFDPVLGEDTWELFEVIEYSFGVDLGDYHEICGKTVSELAEVIQKNANYPTEDKCLSAVAFYRLRRAFETLFGVPRGAIRPATPVGSLLPLKHRSAEWQMLQKHLGLDVPGLTFPAWFLLVPLVTPPALLISLRALFGFRLSVGWIVCGSLMFIYLTVARVIPAMNFHFPIARVIPTGCKTFGGLAKVVLARNYAAFASQGGSCKDGILETLQQLTAMQLAMDVEKISPETRIPQDLNIY
jgi:hypothetical protein